MQASSPSTSTLNSINDVSALSRSNRSGVGISYPRPACDYHAEQKSGILWKRGKKKDSFHRRLFILDGEENTLRYYNQATNVRKICPPWHAPLLNFYTRVRVCATARRARARQANNIRAKTLFWISSCDLTVWSTSWRHGYLGCNIDHHKEHLFLLRRCAALLTCMSCIYGSGKSLCHGTFSSLSCDVRNSKTRDNFFF